MKTTVKVNKTYFNIWGFLVWLIFGIGSMFINWENILFWIVGTYFWISLVEKEIE